MNPDKLTIEDWRTLAMPVLIERLVEIMRDLDTEKPMPRPTVEAAHTIRATFSV